MIKLDNYTSVAKDSIFRVSIDKVDSKKVMFYIIGSSTITMNYKTVADRDLVLSQL